ncbi:MAG TPA: hypothetical protein PLS84_08175 [Salinivirgaceae bacterium]|nr:hypothetical protein [Salinivirgaceae bacterium]
MIPLYTQTEFDLAKDNDKLPCKCVECGKIFYKLKRVIKRTFIGYDRNIGDYCSRRCARLSKKSSADVVCSNCGKSFNKVKSQIKRSKNHFCSKSCSAIYNNVHKKHGTRKSKLEKWLEYNLTKIYPDLNFHFNCKDTINSELDIYIPSLKLAFELNGIYHYEPIYGEDKLQQIQSNDNRKFQACLEKGIELCIIDTSQQKYFKEQTSQKYLKIVQEIINTHR